MTDPESPASSARTIYRCARCGVESAERRCFVIPGSHDRPPRDTRCLVCDQARHTSDTVRNLRIAVGALAFPFFLYVMFAHGFTGLTVWIVLAGCLMQPLATVLHELGHAVVGRLTGLDVAAIELGFGKRVWKGRVGGTLLILRSWPLSGRTFLGARERSSVKVRVWLTTLAGPAVNTALIFPVTYWWESLADVFGVPLMMLWVFINGMTLIINLLPRRFVAMGRPQRSDGLALLEIPRLTEAQLAPYFISASVARVLASLEGQDYTDVIAECRRGLALAPKDPWLLLMLSGAQNRLGEYRDALAGANSTGEVKDPILRAAIENNQAFSLLMLNLKGDPDEAAVSRVDELSKSAFEAFPCLLSLRSTRALVLAATQREEQAIAMLEYVHYRNASPLERGDMESVRAYALCTMGRTKEAESAAQEAARLNPRLAPILRTLGFRESADGAMAGPVQRAADA